MFCFLISVLLLFSSVRVNRGTFVTQHSLFICMDSVMDVSSRLLGKYDWSALLETIGNYEEKLAIAMPFQKCWCDQNKTAMFMTKYLQNKWKIWFADGNSCLRPARSTGNRDVNSSVCFKTLVFWILFVSIIPH